MPGSETSEIATSIVGRSFIRDVARVAKIALGEDRFRFFDCNLPGPKSPMISALRTSCLADSAWLAQQPAACRNALSAQPWPMLPR